MGKPSNEIGAPVPLRLILGRSERVAVALVGATAYSTGAAMTLSVRRRHRADPEEFEDFEFYGDPFGSPFGHPLRRRRGGGELPPEILRFGVQFSDGRKATTLGDRLPWEGRAEGQDEGVTSPMLLPGGGGGSDGEWESQFWLWPLPPPGPLTFAVEWPSEQIELTKHEVDAALLIEASNLSEKLWPGEGSDEASMSQSRRFVLGTDLLSSGDSENGEPETEASEEQSEP